MVHKDKNYIISFKWRWLFRQIGTKCIYDQMWLDAILPVVSFSTFEPVQISSWNHLQINHNILREVSWLSPVIGLLSKQYCPVRSSEQPRSLISWTLEFKTFACAKFLRTSRLKWVGPECGNGIYVVCVPFYDRNFVVFHEK